MFELPKVGVIASFSKRSYKYKPQPLEQQPTKKKGIYWAFTQELQWDNQSFAYELQREERS